MRKKLVTIISTSLVALGLGPFFSGCKEINDDKINNFYKNELCGAFSKFNFMCSEIGEQQNNIKIYGIVNDKDNQQALVNLNYHLNNKISTINTQDDLIEIIESAEPISIDYNPVNQKYEFDNNLLKQ